MQINSLERAVSTDINRLQTFLSTDIAAILSYLFDNRTSDVNSGGTEDVGKTVTTPLRAVVIGGIRFRPELGTKHSFIEVGTLVIVDPEPSPNPDDHPLKWIQDPGVQTIGVLTNLQTGDLQTRFDMIECQPVETVLETANRDIFNEATGQFTPTLVTKAVRWVLSYRIRHGVPGGGLAGLGLSAGWLPLAVARVPSIAATWDDVDVWDVRPLLADFVGRCGRQDHVTQPTWFGRRQAKAIPALVTAEVDGCVEGSFKGMRAGGFMNQTSLGASIDLLTSKEAGFALVQGYWYLYAVFPMGLPRWALYDRAVASPRVPLGFRGVPVFSMQSPSAPDGLAPGPINLPTASAMGGNTSDGVALLAGPVNSGPSFLGMIMNGGWVYHPGNGQVPSKVNIDATHEDYTFNAIPSVASAIRVRWAVTVSSAGDSVGEVNCDLSGRNGMQSLYTIGWRSLGYTLNAANGHQQLLQFEEVVPLDVPQGFGSPSGNVVRFHAGSNAGDTIAFLDAQVTGYRFGV
jgi:hypothetical protein